MEERLFGFEVREGRLTSRGEALKNKEDSFSQRLRDTRNHYRTEVVTLTTRLSQESLQLRNEASLLRQAEQEADFQFQAAKNASQAEASQSE